MKVVSWSGMSSGCGRLYPHLAVLMCQSLFQKVPALSQSRTVFSVPRPSGVLPVADTAVFDDPSEGLGSTGAALQHDAAPSAGFMAPLTAKGGLPAPDAALRTSLRAAGLRAAAGNGWAEAAPVHGMIPTVAAKPAVSPRAQPTAIRPSEKRRRASDPQSEVESEPASSSESVSSSDEDDFAPSSKRAKLSTTSLPQRRTRAGSRAAANGSTGGAEGSKSRGRRKLKAGRRVVAGSHSDENEPAKPLAGKGGRRKPAIAELETGSGETGAMDLILPPPPPLPVKHRVTAAGALRAEDVVLEVRASFNCQQQVDMVNAIQPVKSTSNRAHTLGMAMAAMPPPRMSRHVEVQRHADRTQPVKNAILSPHACGAHSIHVLPCRTRAAWRPDSCGIFFQLSILSGSRCIVAIFHIPSSWVMLNAATHI